MKSGASSDSLVGSIVSIGLDLKSSNPGPVLLISINAKLLLFLFAKYSEILSIIVCRVGLMFIFEF